MRLKYPVKQLCWSFSRKKNTGLYSKKDFRNKAPSLMLDKVFRILDSLGFHRGLHITWKALLWDLKKGLPSSLSI